MKTLQERQIECRRNEAHDIASNNRYGITFEEADAFLVKYHQCENMNEYELEDHSRIPFGCWLDDVIDCILDEREDA